MFQVVTMGMLLECCSGQSNSPCLKLTSAATLTTLGRYMDEPPVSRREFYGHVERGYGHDSVMVWGQA